MTVTESIARFIHALDLDQVPAEVAEKTRVCLLNGYGIGLGCHDTPFAPVAREAALALDGEVPNGATLLGDGRKTTVAEACLANSALFHGRAQEDTCGARIGKSFHPWPRGAARFAHSAAPQRWFDGAQWRLCRVASRYW